MQIEGSYSLGYIVRGVSFGSDEPCNGYGDERGSYSSPAEREAMADYPWMRAATVTLPARELTTTNAGRKAA